MQSRSAHCGSTRKMPFRSSSAIPRGSAKLTSSRCSRRTTSVADSTTGQAEFSTDSLVIEDLDLDDLDISPFTVRTTSPSADDTSTGEHPYPEVDSNRFLQEQVPSVISETCLMNDLYILVKVPTNPKRLVPTSTASSQTTPKRAEQSPDLYLNSNRTIFPIHEEDIEETVREQKSRIPVASKPTSNKSCWTKETDINEEFVSTTNIIRCNNLVPLPNQVPDDDEPEEVLFEFSRRPESPPPCQTQIELKEVNLNSVRFKGPANISLENYGILITPTKTPKTENLLVFQVDTEPKDQGRGKCSSCFEWFTKFFRRKRRRTGFVHAKVYKTYFVKWKKCSEDSECSRCQCKTSNKHLRRNSA